MLAATGVEVEIEKVLVESAEQARALLLVSSPTIRVDGHDIALDLRESPCGSEPCTDQIACRVWVHFGREYTEPPVAMIVDAILAHVYAGAASSGAPGSERYELPENLARFFAARTGPSECCSRAEQESCCEAEANEECCGEGCGCR